MALESEILVTNYGISSEFADNLLHFTKGDVEGAIKILEASEKDVIALKAKFISSKKMTNGSIIVFYNFQTNLPEFVFCVVSSDQSLGKMKIENHWNSFIEDMKRFVGSVESDPEAASRIESQVLSPENVKYINSFFIDKSNFDMVNIKRFLVSEVSKVMMDTGIVIKITTEEVDVFRFKNYFNESKFGLKVIIQNPITNGMLINIKVDPILTPIGGVDVEKTQIDDQVLVRFVDERQIVSYIKDLSMSKEENNGAIYGKVIRNIKSMDTNNIIVTLEFGPGIYGTFIMGGKVKVQTILAKKKTSENKIPEIISGDNKKSGQDLSHTTQQENKNNSRSIEVVKKSNTFLIILIVLLFAAILGIIIVLIFG